jgi:hypothetical protein
LLNANVFYGCSAAAVLSLMSAPPASAGDPAETDTPPFTVAADLFDQSRTDTLGLSEAEGAQTFTIYAPQADDNTFNNHPQLMPFKGRLYATWQGTPKHEDSPDSFALVSHSDDGATWSEPTVIAGPIPGEHYHASGGLWSDGQTLVNYVIKLGKGHKPGTLKSTWVRTTTDGEHWTDLQELIPDATLSENPRQLPGGRLIVTAHGPTEAIPMNISRIFYTDQGDGLGGWHEAYLPHIPSKNRGRGLEPSWFRRGDGSLVMVFRDMDRTFRLLASESFDAGQTWTLPVLTDMPDSASMQCAGNLPDGTAVMVNNPVSEGRRIPLAVTLSDDGRHFDRAVLVRGAPPPRRFDGAYKDLGYSYPGMVVWNDALWVTYATNKEDIEVTRIPLAALSDASPSTGSARR